MTIELSRGRSGRTLIERALQGKFDGGENEDYGSDKQLKSSIWRATRLLFEQSAKHSTGATIVQLVGMAGTIYLKEKRLQQNCKYAQK